MPNWASIDKLRQRYPDIGGNPATATSGPDPENNEGTDSSITNPPWAAPDPTDGQPFSSTRQIPYRGAEPHGVPFTPETHPDPYTETTMAGQVPVPVADYEGIPQQDPVPVRVVENAPDPNERKRFVATSLSLVTPGQAFRIAGYRENRTKLKIATKSIALGGAFSTAVANRAAGTGFTPTIPAGTMLLGFDITWDTATAAWTDFIQANINGWPGNAPRWQVAAGVGQTQRLSVTFPSPITVGSGGASGIVIPTDANMPAWSSVIYTQTPSAIGRVWISADESPGAIGSGIPLDAGDSWESNTTDDVWAALDSAASSSALVTVYDEFVVDIPRNTRRAG